MVGMPIEEKIQKLEQELTAIKDRNIRVEADKAWEVSIFRITSIAIITYVVAALILFSIGVKGYLLNAFVPTVGYLLSTQSIPLLKKWWVRRYVARRNNGNR